MKVLVIGASVKEDRYSNKAIKALNRNGHETIGLGRREGQVDETSIAIGMPNFEGVDTITMYVGPQNQPEYYEYILSLKPRRVIFNPGTENQELESKLASEGIESENACTLVMLNLGIF